MSTRKRFTNAMGRFALVPGVGGSGGSTDDAFDLEDFVTEQDDLLVTEQGDILATAQSKRLANG